MKVLVLGYLGSMIHFSVVKSQGTITDAQRQALAMDMISKLEQL